MAPVSIALKIFHQQLCKMKIGWDDLLEGDILGKWQLLVQALQETPTISLPRYYFADTSDAILEVNLHGFCDASTTAYAAVIYLTVTSKTGISTQLVAAKTRVAPLSQQTIPRLELLAALIPARLITAVATTLMDVMCINSIGCWSDSKVALAWVKGEHQEWKQFVQNRVDEIRRLVPASAWSYCSTLCRPADLPSRGVSPSNLTSSIWFTGPTWLS